MNVAMTAVLDVAVVEMGLGCVDASGILHIYIMRMSNNMGLF